MARAKNVSRRQRRPEAVREELLPGLGSGRAAVLQRACRSAGPPPRRSRARRPAPARGPAPGWGALHRHQQLLEIARLQIVLHGDVPVGGVDAAARKHVAARHEHHVEAPPPQQHARLARRLSTMIRVAASRGRSVLRVAGAALRRRRASVMRRLTRWCGAGRSSAMADASSVPAACGGISAFIGACGARAIVACARLAFAGAPPSRLPSDSISKRSAPAVGIASTRRTRTSSPRR